MLNELPPLNVFRIMGRGPESFRPFPELAFSIPVESEFDARKREIAVLRVADEIGRDVRRSDEALAASIGRYGERQAMELILCCAYFNTLSGVPESAPVPLKETPVPRQASGLAKLREDR